MREDLVPLFQFKQFGAGMRACTSLSNRFQGLFTLRSNASEFVTICVDLGLALCLNIYHPTRIHCAKRYAEARVFAQSIFQSTEHVCFESGTADPQTIFAGAL